MNICFHQTYSPRSCVPRALGSCKTYYCINLLKSHEWGTGTWHTLERLHSLNM